MTQSSTVTVTDDALRKNSVLPEKLLKSSKISVKSSQKKLKSGTFLPSKNETMASAEWGGSLGIYSIGTKKQSNDQWRLLIFLSFGWSLAGSTLEQFHGRNVSTFQP